MKPWDELRDSWDQAGQHAHVPVHCLHCGMPQFPERSVGPTCIRVAFRCSTCGWAVTAKAAAQENLAGP